MTKTCCRCQESKPISLFGKAVAKKDGLNSACKECRIKEGRAYRVANKEKISARWKEKYKLDPSRKRKAYEVYKAKDKGKNQRRRAKHRYHTDPVYRLMNLICSKLGVILNGKRKFAEKSMIPSIVGFTGEKLVKHLWDTFEVNYGIPRGWVKRSDVEIDHIIPKCTAKTLDDVRRLNHYTNLQLLLKEDNQQKRSKLPEEQL